MEFTHYPVLYQEILDIIIQQQPLSVLDCTFGLGGHSQLILQNTRAIITAIDGDINVMPWVENLQKLYPNRLKFINSKFSKAIELLKSNNEKFDFILGDFGLSSMQIDNPIRGFSFSKKGPLRMDIDNQSYEKCQWLVNNSPINILANTIKNYGQERNYYLIAKNIVNNRPIQDTYHLRTIIQQKVYDKNSLNKTLARVFQAIRIYTNDELNEIQQLLNNIEYISHNTTKFCWIYFHSLEGNQVHNWYKIYKKKTFRNMKLIVPSHKEIKENHRSRSAIMMVI
jgi:16S rRNA (cytosine1402-N4)-methyltransferase